MLVDVYISERLYRVISIGIPSIDKNLITYLKLDSKAPTLKIYRADEYFRLFLNKIILFPQMWIPPSSF